MADVAPIIVIKKIKKGGHGHHGGAWKVAYADFVTAMMAFFLLLWLLNVTTKDQKLGIADYFAPTFGLKGEMGIGFKGGTANNPGTTRSDMSKPGIIHGSPTTGEHDYGGSGEDAEENKSFDKTEREIKEVFSKNPQLSEFKDNIIIDQTEEGLRIQIVDQAERAMFKSGSASLEEHTKIILSKIAEIIGKLPNNLSIGGHTDSSPYTVSVIYSNWELSSDRANAARRFLLARKINDARIKKVSGNADRELLDERNPQSPRNRRISIVLLKRSISRSNMPAPEELLKVPNGRDSKSNLNFIPKTIGDETKKGG